MPACSDSAESCHAPSLPADRFGRAATHPQRISLGKVRVTVAVLRFRSPRYAATEALGRRGSNRWEPADSSASHFDAIVEDFGGIDSGGVRLHTGISRRRLRFCLHGSFDAWPARVRPATAPPRIRRGWFRLPFADPADDLDRGMPQWAAAFGFHLTCAGVGPRLNKTSENAPDRIGAGRDTFRRRAGKSRSCSSINSPM